MTLADIAGADGAPQGGAGTRLLAVYEPRPSGTAVLARAAELVRGGAELTVVVVARQDVDPPNCTVYGEAYNAQVRGDAAAELLEARALMGPAGDLARYRVLVDGRDPPIDQWASERFDLALLPRRRVRRRGSHPAAEALRQTGIRVETVTGRR